MVAVVRFVVFVRKVVMEVEALSWFEIEVMVEVWFIRVCWSVTPGEVAPPM